MNFEQFLIESSNDIFYDNEDKTVIVNLEQDDEATISYQKGKWVLDMDVDEFESNDIRKIIGTLNTHLETSLSRKEESELSNFMKQVKK